MATDRYSRTIDAAERSADYWREGAIIEFTEDVCRIMDEEGISRAELARRLGTSRAYVTKLLGGNANFSLSTMVRVAMAVNGVLHTRVEGRGDRPRRSRRASAVESAARVPKRQGRLARHV